MTYDRKEPVYTETLYDMASCTKICATTMATMKLYDEGRLDLQKTLGDYLPWVKGSDKDFADALGYPAAPGGSGSGCRIL